MPILCVCVCIVIGTMQNLMQIQTFDTKCEQNLTDLDTKEGRPTKGVTVKERFYCSYVTEHAATCSQISIV